MTEANTVNMDSLLDANLDDLADLPEFKPFPNGVHKATIEFETKVVNEKPSVILHMTAVETVELVDATTDSVLVPGAKTDVLFQLDNDFGQGQLKAIAKVLASHFGTTSLRQTMDASKGAEVLAVCKVRFNKDKTQSYTSVVEIGVV